MKEQCPDVSGFDPSPYEVYMPPSEVARLLAKERAERLTNLTRQVLKDIVDETAYRPDLEWGVFHRSRELEDTNGLPEGVSAQDVMDCFYRVFHHED